MPARDTYHDTVKIALIRDGWTITHDPFILSTGFDRVYVDLGAEQSLAAERAGEKIAVEIKSFRGKSDLKDLEQALGQFLLYNALLRRAEPTRTLFLAVPEPVYENTLTRSIARPALEDLHLPLIVFRPAEERIVRWIP